MSLFLVLQRSRCLTQLSSPRPRLCHPGYSFLARKYATHRGTTPSSILSQTLDTKQRAVPNHESVGPFQLGIAQPSFQRDEKVPKWSELSTGGKVIRTTARTTNLTVILLGAGLSVLLIYSLTSELFSKNSPTVLYGDACDRIRGSPQVAKYLCGPLTFHNNPPSMVRPRHRNRHVSSQIMVDAYGREHMIMSFFIQGKSPGSAPTDDDSSYLESISAWTKDTFTILSALTFDESVEWINAKSLDVWERSKSVFRYLTGSPLPPTSLPQPSHENVREAPRKPESSAWSFAGMFSSLKGSRSGRSEQTAEPSGRIWTEGEVHADLIRNHDGYFTFRYLLVDIPNSKSRDSVRVFIERTPDVRKDERVLHWDS